MPLIHRLHASGPGTLILVAILSFVAIPRPASAGERDKENNGPVTLLVKTRVALTPDVVATLSAKASRTSYVWPEIRVLAMEMAPSAVATLAANPLVERVESDLGFDAGSDSATSQSIPNSTSATPIQTWNLDMADVAGTGRTGAGVTVAVVDAGLPQNWRDFLPEGAIDLDHAAGFGPNGVGSSVNPVNAIRGVGGHLGLFPHCVAVSSVITGFPSVSGPIGGAAPGARILPIRILDQFNFARFTWMTAGIMYVGHLKASGALPGPVVINFSIQAHGASQALADAIDYAIANGVLFVTIAGNFNPADYVSFPGRLPESITAGAIGWRGENGAPDWFFGDVPENDPGQAYVAGFSGRESPETPTGSQIDVLAPGSWVFGEWLFDPGYSDGRNSSGDASAFIFGTSFAAPHVAAIVAQMLEKNPGLTQAQAEGILRSSALPLPAAPNGAFTGFGFVPPWDERATGAGIARGAAAVSATPLPLIASRTAGIASLRDGDKTSDVRVTSRPGVLPVTFDLGRFGRGAWRASIFDAGGRRMRMWDGRAASGATGTWDGRGDSGQNVSPGVYFLRVESGERTTGASLFILR